MMPLDYTCSRLVSSTAVLSRKLFRCENIDGQASWPFRISPFELPISNEWGTALMPLDSKLPEVKAIFFDGDDDSYNNG